MFAIKTTDDGERFFFFAGWDGSDSMVLDGEMTYWKEDPNHPEVYEYNSLEEVSIEQELLLTSNPQATIGLPDDFDYESAFMQVFKIREDHF